jgi:hypothetical protein
MLTGTIHQHTIYFPKSRQTKRLFGERALKRISPSTLQKKRFCLRKSAKPTDCLGGCSKKNIAPIHFKREEIFPEKNYQTKRLFGRLAKT